MKQGISQNSSNATFQTSPVEAEEMNSVEKGYEARCILAFQSEPFDVTGMRPPLTPRA